MACAADTLDPTDSTDPTDANDSNDTNDTNDTNETNETNEINDSGDAMSVPRTRDDLVGKRFLLVANTNPNKLKTSRASDWPWRSGLIRCASHLDTKDADLQVLVEFDNIGWEKREWLQLHKDNFQIFLVEDSLCVVKRNSPPPSSVTGTGSIHPALAFKPLVDQTGLWKTKHVKPIEFVVDLKVEFHDYSELQYLKAWDPSINGLNLSVANQQSVNDWSELQCGQHILITTPSVLLGFRLKVYRAEGTTQWYTAVTTGYNESTNEFTLTDDTVLEEHFEDPRLTQMKLLGEGVINSILRGENIGITPRRSRSGLVKNTSSASITSKTSTKSSRPINLKTAHPKKSTSTSASSTPEPSSRDKSPGAKGKNPSSPSSSDSSSIMSGSEVALSVGNTLKRGRGRPPSSVTRSEPVNLAKHLRLNDSAQLSQESQQLRGRRSLDNLNPARHNSRRKSSINSATSSTKTPSSESNSSSEESTTSTPRPPILSNRKESKGKRKAIAIVRPQQHVRENKTPEKISRGDLEEDQESRDSTGSLDKKEKNPPEADRQARFSLYDFPSDSEAEERCSKSNGTEKSDPTCHDNRVSTPRRTSESDSKKSQTTISREMSPSQLLNAANPSIVLSEIKSSNAGPLALNPAGDSNKGGDVKDPLEVQTPADTPGQVKKSQKQNNDSELQDGLTISYRMQPVQSLNFSTHQHPDLSNHAAQPSRDHRGDDNRSTDSGVSTIRSISGDERSGSRSSTVSDDRSLRPSPYLPESSSTSPPCNSRPSISGASSQSVWRDPHSQQARSLSITKVSPQHSVLQAAMAEQARLAASSSGGASGPPPPVHIAQLTMQQILASHSAFGVHPHNAAAVLAQYQQSMNMGSLNPDMLKMSQYPGGMPPGLLNRSSGPPSHAEMMRERECREADQRDRNRADKQRLAEKERRELDRQEVERYEREREQRKIDDDVNKHFKLSMELAQKLPQLGRYMYHQRTAHQWSNLPGGARPPAPSAEEERRRVAEADQRRAQDAQYLNMVGMSNAAASASRHGHSLTPTSTSLVPRSQPMAGGHNNNKPAHTPYPPSSAVAAHYQNSHINGPKEAGQHHMARTNGVPMSAHNVVMPKSYANYLPTNDPKYPMGYKHFEYPPRSTPSSQGLSSAQMTHHARHPVQDSRVVPSTSERQSQGARYPPSALTLPSTQRLPLGGSSIPSQFYEKPNGSHPTSHLGGVPAAHSAVSDYQPPPAHGGSARHPAVHVPPPEPMSNHFNHNSAIPIRLTPHDLAPPVPQATVTHTDQPLDLGLPAKRRANPQDDISSNEESVSPKKLPRIETCAQLYKVSEPSVLPASEPSLITTVVNSAISAAIQPVIAISEPPSAAKDSPQVEKKGEPEEQVFGYVHKLKKAWIKSYNCDDATSNGASSSPPPSQAQTSSVRATPSPAPSNKSTASGTSSTRGRARPNLANARKTGPKAMNGHAYLDAQKMGHLTSSSESEEDDDDSQTYSSSSRRAPVPRRASSRRGGRGRHLRTRGNKSLRNSRSNTASSGDNDSDRDSDASVSHNSLAGNSKSLRKRGRKPGRGAARSSAGNNIPAKGNVAKKFKDENASLSSSSTTSEVTNLKKKRPSVAQLKKTGQSFLQDASCFEVAPKLAKCLECSLTQSQRNKKTPNIFCRFYDFRRVRFAKNGQVCVAGFCDPKKDVSKEDLDLWVNVDDSVFENLNDQQAEFVLCNLTSEFETMLMQERQAKQSHHGEDQVIAWKRVVQGVREMCDVCDANLFNYHWACGKCGFVVCLDCYLDRKDEVIRPWNTKGSDRDKYSWLLCTNRNQHEVGRLMLTQIIADDALETIAKKVGVDKQEAVVTNGVKEESSDESKTHLRDLIGTKESKKAEITTQATGEDSKPMNVEYKFFVRGSVGNKDERSHYVWRKGDACPIKSFDEEETRKLYPEVPHSWLSNGKVLRLNSSEKDDAKSLPLYQDVWKRGQPVVIGMVSKTMKTSLWEPSRFGSDCGDLNVSLENVQIGEAFHGRHTLKKFWEGFSNVSKRLRDEDGEPAVLKLKDWPVKGRSGEEFIESFPQHTSDLLANLPVKPYTDRGELGKYNLASNLPELFVRPDLGPRTYISYGDSQSPDVGTYNLHIELADTVTIIVKAETPSDLDIPEYKNQIMRTLEFVGCNDQSNQRSANDSDALPATLWHIFHPDHADSIRDFLNKEAFEKRAKAKRLLTKKSRAAAAASSNSQTHDDDEEGEGGSGSGDKVDLHYDPIHSETVYLTKELLKKLEDGYGVTPFVFTLYEGEAAMIPAGAPRQVKNLQSCISVSVDFVSPENLAHSCHMVRQFRYLPKSQQPAPEDRFQVKNIVFHSVKKAIAARETKK